MLCWWVLPRSLLILVGINSTIACDITNKHYRIVLKNYIIDLNDMCIKADYCKRPHCNAKYIAKCVSLRKSGLFNENST